MKLHIYKIFKLKLFNKYFNQIIVETNYKNMQNNFLESWKTPTILQTISRPLVTPEISALVEETMRLFKTSSEVRKVLEEVRKQNQKRFTWYPLLLEKTKLEPFNFRVYSSLWTEKIDKSTWIKYKESPTWDMWEYIDWVPEELEWEQLFTWDARVRETTKAWKRMPTYEEWFEICKPYISVWSKRNWERLTERLWMPFAGEHWYRYSKYESPSPYFEGQRKYLFYWSSSIDTSNNLGVWLYVDSIYISVPHHKEIAHGFSVRCFKK